MKTWLIITLTLLLAVIVLLATRSWLSRDNPPVLGVTGGVLAVCSDRPNCVSSQATDADQRIAPLAYVGDRDATQQRLLAIFAEQPRLQQIVRGEDYWRYQQVSALFRFIDDIELYFDDRAALVHLRSASRVGYSDIGVNRKRIEAWRAALMR
jgi:uncharacterized protein (DUF1499 family)